MLRVINVDFGKEDKAALPRRVSLRTLGLGAGTQGWDTGDPQHSAHVAGWH